MEKDHAEYAGEWHRNHPQRDEDDNSSYCNLPDHGCDTCFYLLEHKPSGWTPSPLLWCFNYQSVKSNHGCSRQAQNESPTEMLENQNMPSREHNMLLKLPGEIRNQVYTCLFASTRLTFGKRIIAGFMTAMIKPAPNSLAILRTCRQIKQEAETLWLGLVLFNFERPESMLDKLSTLPLNILSEIRHVRVGGCSLLIQRMDSHEHVFYRLVSVLKLLPKLRLDKLTVLGESSGAIAYLTCEGLIKCGNGWRELNFITRNSEMLKLPRGYIWQTRSRPSLYRALGMTCYPAVMDRTLGLPSPFIDPRSLTFQALS